MPTVHLVLKSQGYKAEPDNGSYSIMGVFEALASAKFPYKTSFALIIYWGGNIGERFKHFFTIVDENGKVIFTTVTNELVIEAENQISLNAIKDVVFPSAGVYAININVDGISIGKTNIQIIKS